MPEFDPANPPDGSLGSFQHQSVKMYEKLLNRGDEETAEQLRELDTASRQARFIRQEVVEFDPKHDEDTQNSAVLRVRNVYDALVELGHDDLAEELRDYNNVTGQRNRAIELAREVDADIDTVTGEVTPAAEEVR
jgi:recombinational DNA repair ATPase RecF